MTGGEPVEVWCESVHDEAGRWAAARLLLRGDGLLELRTPPSVRVLDWDDARSLWHVLGAALARREAGT